MQFTRPWYDLRSGEEGHRRFDIAIALSVLLHAAALFLIAPEVVKNALSPGEVEGPTSAPISVSLAPRPRPPQPPATSTPPPAASLAPPPPVPPRARPSPRRAVPPMATMPAVPSPDALRVPPPTLAPMPSPRPAQRPPSPPAETDLAAYIAARRAERGEATSTPTESEAARRDRAIQRNLASINAPQPFGGDPKSGGGLFQVTLKSYDFAEFRFYGWNRDVKRSLPQRFEVRKGDNPTIDVAIVKRMILIIRETEKGDFVWRSERQGKDVTLSARPEDNDRLEDFLLKDLFG